MLRIVTLFSLIALLGACDNTANKTSSGTKTTAAHTAHGHAHGHAHGEGCLCAQGKAGKAVWCDKCKAGFVDGKKITNKAEFDKAKAGHKHGSGDCPCGKKSADCTCDKKAECGKKDGGCACGKKGADCTCDKGQGKCDKRDGGDCPCGKKGADCTCDKKAK